MEEFSQDLSVALEEANQQESDSCTEQVMQKPRRPRRRRVRKGVCDVKGVIDISAAGGLGGQETDGSQSGEPDGDGADRGSTSTSTQSQQQPFKSNRSKRNPRMQVEVNERPLGSLAVADDVEMTNVMHQGAGPQGTTNDCPMEGAFSSSSSDLPSECGGCCGCSSEADDEQTDFPHSEPPPPKMAALLVDHPVINRPGPGGRAIGEHGRHHGVGQSGSVGSHHLGGLSIGLSHHHHHVASHLALTNEFRRRVHSAGNRAGGNCSEQAGGRKRRRRCCPLVTTTPTTTGGVSSCGVGSPSVCDSSPALKLVSGCTRDQPTM
ncbi:uncharacterized protein LOC111255618 [Varroa destructor]|uniref:Uncharacterized protein n=1 Tax=Varroa destructor TaxID=109461 RepID=A0A7M7KXH1_VARDE|nr:uncharacterized protein LOC111255618 [Varroa destructor]XP_022673502.1 uncharacterized protein LOC111255618 [Varroa destructor]XP_022673503.1 uncharacterized protein LOC111255618 [Varroa destructor]